jgi:hypothetical protein
MISHLRSQNGTVNPPNDQQLRGSHWSQVTLWLFNIAIENGHL